MTHRKRFFNKKKEFFTAGEIAKICDCEIDEKFIDKKIYDVATIDFAGQNDITFLSSNQYFSKISQSKAGFCIVSIEHSKKIDNKNLILLISKNPYYTYSQVVSLFYEENLDLDFEKNLIHSTAKIGKNSAIAPNVYIGKNVEIGNDCTIFPGAVILDNVIIGDGCKIGANCTISFAIIGSGSSFLSGVKIGQDGFGFANNDGFNFKIAQIGIVEIGENVEIGAGSCIDRGSIENTIICDNVKIDNLVQIGHNVKIGKGTVIAGCAAIAGSTQIGQFVQIGGSANIVGHIKIDDFCKIAGMSGVAKSLPKNSTVAGIPAINIRAWHRINFKLLKL